MTPKWLRSYLLDPQAAKPGTTMPSVLAHVPADRREAIVGDLVQYLVSRGGGLQPAERGGLEHNIEKGQELFHSVGCIACHAPDDVTTSEPSIPLPDLARKTTIDALTEFLLDPLKHRPAGRMPNLRLEEKEAVAIATWLLREQFDNPMAQGEASQPGLQADFYHWGGQKVPNYDEIEPKASELVPEVTIRLAGRDRDNNFSVRLSGRIDIPREGDWTFKTRSDDGSLLWIDGELVVDNDGNHAPKTEAGTIQLSAGQHAFVVGMFESGGGEELQVFWEGPGQKEQQIPGEAFSTLGGKPMIPLDHGIFAVDAEASQRGAQHFEALGCASCHEPERTKLTAIPLSKLGSGGCLDGRSGAHYALSDEQRQEIAAALTDSAPVDASAKVRRHLALMNCTACHQRDGIGGPEAAREPLFTTKFEIDLGDEGRLPPTLDAVGSKLKAAALPGIMARGQHHVRGRYMATRMPSFPEASMEALAEHMVAADMRAGDTKPGAFSQEIVEAGRRITGTRGFACITCHGVNGHKGLGIAGIDLGSVSQRINPGWFRRFLSKPAEVKPGTRMPGFWPGPKSAFVDLLGGDSMAQIDAVYSYLSLGGSMPLPVGVQIEGGAGMEIIPVEEPIVHRTFMADVGPRAIAVGHPENVHFCFDAQVVRLAKLWRGRFFDHSGVQSGRTDKFLPPLGTDVLDVPGPAIAILPKPDAAWPAWQLKGERDVGGKFRGYRFDEQRRPAFRYAVGDVQVEETLIPVLKPGGGVFTRRLQLSVTEPIEGVTFLAWAGQKIEPRDDGSYRIDDTVTVALRGGGAPRVRKSGERMELVVPVSFRQGRIVIEEDIQW